MKRFLILGQVRICATDLRISNQNGDKTIPIIWMENPRHREMKGLASRIMSRVASEHRPKFHLSYFLSLFLDGISPPLTFVSSEVSILGIRLTYLEMGQTLHL